MYKVLEFIDKNSAWSKLKSVQNIKIVQSSYIWLLIVPITAKFFSKIENTLTLSFSGNTYELDLILPFTWVIFFFSALSFTLSNLFIITFSPVIIKDHKNYIEFRNSGGTEEDYLGYLEDHDAQQDITKQFISRNHTFGGDNEKSDDDDEKWFWKIYRKKDKEKVKARYCSYFFYVIGFILFTIVAAQNLLWVIDEIIF